MRYIVYLFIFLPSLILSSTFSSFLDYGIIEWYYIISVNFFVGEGHGLFFIFIAYYPFAIIPAIEYVVRKRKRTISQDLREFE
ncbi:hypothetical protein AUC45_02105 [Erythrobacter sp. YT30]|nr:hypothetical protein AUC45_02105 [Erythrobacter sp. YT30]